MFVVDTGDHVLLLRRTRPAPDACGRGLRCIAFAEPQEPSCVGCCGSFAENLNFPRTFFISGSEQDQIPGLTVWYAVAISFLHVHRVNTCRWFRLFRARRTRIDHVGVFTPLTKASPNVRSIRQMAFFAGFIAILTLILRTFRACRALWFKFFIMFPSRGVLPRPRKTGFPRARI